MKYHWFSKQFWKFKELLLLGPLPGECKRLNTETKAPERAPTRVSEFNAALPNCVCEACRTSEHSPSPVEDSELLARFVMHPVHINPKTGEFKTSLFSHVDQKGCSVQREDLATNLELRLVLDEVSRIAGKSWHGVVSASAKDVRLARSQKSGSRLYWIYDTAEHHNPAHAEIGRASNNLSEEDVQEVRFDLMKIFSQKAMLVRPAQYRSGALVR